MRVAGRIRLLCFLLAGAGGLVRADVDLDPAQRDNLGIRTEPPQVITVARTWQAAAQVLDVAPLVKSLSELHSAETAAAASASELARAEQLHRTDTNVALKAVEAARSQSVTDVGRVATAKSDLFASWGSGMASLSAAARQRLLEDLVAGKLSLVRAEPSAPVPVAVRIVRAQLQSLDEGRTWSAEWLGSMPQTNTASLAGALLFRVNASLPSGQILTARLEASGADVRGLSVPSAAVVHWRGSEWIYEETRPNHFERRGIKSGMSAGDRTLIEDASNVTHAVVTVGARALLAAEQGVPAAEAED